jgi:hypothetical protein
MIHPVKKNLPMKKIVLLFSVLFVMAVANQAKAQDYSSAIGLRFGSPISLSYKFFISDPNAIELYLGYRGYANVYSWINFGGLFEVHNQFPDVEGLKWYYGAGVSALLFNYKYDIYDNGSFGVGISGVLGLDYKFADAPFNLSLDIQPTLRIGGWDDGFYAWYALSARYVLK